MPNKSATVLILRFAYRHIQTEGKLQNIIDALEEIDSPRVCLSLTEPGLDETMLAGSVISERFGQVKKAIAELHRNKITVDLVLPGVWSSRATDNAYKRYLKSLYANAAEMAVRTIWVDDAVVTNNRRSTRRGILASFNSIRRAVHTGNPLIRLGLIAAMPEQYARSGVTATEIAEVLAGHRKPLLAQIQPYQEDYCRTEILTAANTIISCLALNGTGTESEMSGAIEHRWASPFHKSAESDQMQMNLNILFGLNGIMVNCFDQAGTAPGSENLYVEMYKNRRRFLDKLAKLMPKSHPSAGIRVIIPDCHHTAGRPTCTKSITNDWPIMLWRMGLPIDAVTTTSIKPDDNTNPLYILTGDTPKQLTRRQLNHIFKNGVMLDSRAAETIQQMGLPGLIGTKVGKAIKNVQSEIISDQCFAAPYFGHNTILTGTLQSDDYRFLKPVHANTRIITTLKRKNQIPNTNGAVLFDNTEHNHRCAILPYSFGESVPPPLLCIERQRHFRDVFAWLLRRRLDCFVENTPDLVPFYIPDHKRKRIILALLNVGFDWAIDSRIRLGQVPFPVNRVRQLDEQGRFVNHADLLIHNCRDYRYIQLTSDTAVPPMQMTVLVLDS